MWIKSAVVLCFIVVTLAAEDSRRKKEDEPRGKRNLQYSIAHHYAGPHSQNHKAERRISSGYQLPLYHPQSYFPAPGPGLRPYKGRPYTLPIPPYAVQMEPLVHYSQRDPLYDTNSLSLHADAHNELAKPEDLLTETNHISESVYGHHQPQHHTRIIEKPVYIKEPEPIIEIIIKESNVTLPPAPQISVTPAPKKKEEVQVFYVKYKKNPNGHGKNSIIYDKPVPAISPPIHDEEEHEPPPVNYHHQVVTQPPPPSTTHRTIIKPDSETYHSPTGVKVTFGKEGFDYSKRSSKADDVNRNTRPRTHSAFSQGRQLHSFPPNFGRPSNYESSSEYNFEPQRIPQPYRPFNQPNQSFRQPRPDFNRPPTHEQPSQVRFPTFQGQPPARLPFSRQPFSRHPSQPPQQVHQNTYFQNQPLFGVPRQPVPYQPFESLKNNFHPQTQTESGISFRPETHFPIRQPQHSPSQIQQPSQNFNNQPPTHIPTTQETIQNKPQDGNHRGQFPQNHQFLQNVRNTNQQFGQQHVTLQEPQQFVQSGHNYQNVRFTQHRIPQNNDNQVAQKQQADISQSFQHQVNHNQQFTQNRQPQIIQSHQPRGNQHQPEENQQQYQPQVIQNQQSQLFRQQSIHNQQGAQDNQYRVPQNHKPANSQSQAVSQVRIQHNQYQQTESPQSHQNAFGNYQGQQQNSQQNVPNQQYQQQFGQQQQQQQQQQQYNQQQNSGHNIHSSQSNDDSPRSELIPSLSKYEQHISVDSSEDDSNKGQYQFQQHNQQQPQTSQQQTQLQQQNDFSNQYKNQQQQNQRPSVEEYNRKVKQQLENVKLLQNNAQRYQQAPRQQQEQPRYINNGFEAVQQSIQQNQFSSSPNKQTEQKNKHENIFATPTPTTYTTSQQKPTPDFRYIYRSTTAAPSSTPATTTEVVTQSTTTKDPKILEAQLPDEVPEDLRAQLLSSGILNHASISVLDYDKVGDIPLSALPPDQLANFFNAGGAQQIASGSEPVPSIVEGPQDTKQDEVEEDGDQEMEGSERDEVKVKLQEQQGVEMKVVRYDPRTSQGQQIQEAYVREDATQLEPVELNGEQYNRYLPLKINGSRFPIPDVPELEGKRITSVVVLAPVTYDFSPARRTRDTQDSADIDLIQGKELKELLKNPTRENYRKFLKSEKEKGSDKQSVILLVTGSADDGEKEIFMYNVATKTVNKLSGELSAAFVKAAEENAKEGDSEETSTESGNASSASNIVETRIPFTGTINNKDNFLASELEPDAASSNLEASNVPIIDPTRDELETGESEQLEKFVDVSGMSVEKNEDLTTSTSQNIATSLKADRKKTEEERS